MIDTTKTIGTPDTFDRKRVDDLLSKGVVRSVSNLEKAIFCLEYLGQLQNEGLDFIFKGGSAVQVLLRDKWTRLSIDIDICTTSPREELEKLLSNIYDKFNKNAFSYRSRDREISGDIPFYLYKIKTPSITDVSRSFLLDVMGMKPMLSTRRIQLKTFFFDSSIEVTIPTIGALLGDKLSTIGPTTIGRELKISRNGLEYAKHFNDINSLEKSNFNLKDCAQAYDETIAVQSKIRGKEYTRDECFKDLVFTCQIASVPQQIGEKIIQKIVSADLRERATSEFKILQNGLAQFQPLLIQKLNYSWDQLRSYAAQTALLAKVLNNRIPEKKTKKILNANIPESPEEISKLIKRIESLPREKHWFIEPNEIGNFPEILKTWHSFFFLDKIP